MKEEKTLLPPNILSLETAALDAQLTDYVSVLFMKGMKDGKRNLFIKCCGDLGRYGATFHPPHRSILSEINVKEGGKNFKFTIPKGSDNILDAALAKSADLPFACKGGVCCTCKAKLIEGEVDMEFTYGLEQEEIDEGYVLTCQAIPLSPKVVVDFDAAIANV